MMEIPSIDLLPARFEGSDGERAVAAQLDRACREIGFFTLTGHGIDPGIFARAYAALERFFGRPAEERAAFRPSTGFTLAGDDYTPYGYSGPFEENAFAYMGVPDKPDDCVEKLSAGRLILDDQQRLPFPEDPAGRELRQALKAYFAACEILSARVVELLTGPLGLPRDYFARRIDRSDDSMRAHRYPSSAAELPHDQGMGEHTDGTLVTLLTHTSPGIEVRTREGGWVCPPADRIDHFLVNIGDLLQHWTGGRYVSTGHRVVLAPEPRLSIVFFKLTNEDEMVQFGNKQMDALFGRTEKSG